MSELNSSHNSRPPKISGLIDFIKGPVLKFQYLVVVVFWAMLLGGLVILLIIRNQLDFSSGGVPQNATARFWLIYCLIEIGVFVFMTVSFTLVSVYIRVRVWKMKKYLKVHGKEGEAKIIGYRILPFSPSLFAKYSHMVDYELEFEHRSFHVLGYMRVSFTQQIPKVGDSIKVLYFLDDPESMVLKKSWV